MAAIENNWIDLYNYFDKDLPYKRPLIKIFMNKLELIPYFNTKMVRGDGCCMLYMINELIGENKFSKEILAELLLSDKYKDIKESYKSAEKKDLIDELFNTNNLSEIFLRIISKEINKNIFGFFCKIDKNEYFTVDVKYPENRDTIYILNKDGHYYPLQKKNERDIIDNEFLKSIWLGKLDISQKYYIKYLKYKNKYLELKKK